MARVVKLWIEVNRRAKLRQIGQTQENQLGPELA
jgi:hypothetical protein